MAALVAFSAGRFAAPTRVVTQTKDVYVAKVREAAKVEATQTAKTDEHKGGTFTGRRTTTTTPGGAKTVVEDGTVVWGDHTQTETTQQLSFAMTRERETAHTQETIKTVTHEAPPLMVGIGGGGVVGLDPLGAAPAVAVIVDYRFAGPFSVWGQVQAELPVGRPATAARVGGLVGIGLHF